jgi:hypothetical protein
MAMDSDRPTMARWVERGPRSLRGPAPSLAQNIHGLDLLHNVVPDLVGLALHAEFQQIRHANELEEHGIPRWTSVVVLGRLAARPSFGQCRPRAECSHNDDAVLTQPAHTRVAIRHHPKLE